MNKHELDYLEAVSITVSLDTGFVDSAVADIPLSGLGRLIDDFLTHYPAIAEKHVLERLRDIKQGTFDELESRADFQSYLVSYLGIDSTTLRTITQRLRTHRLVSQYTNDSKVLDIAARGDTSLTIFSSDDLEPLLHRRQFKDHA